VQFVVYILILYFFLYESDIICVQLRKLIHRILLDPNEWKTLPKKFNVVKCLRLDSNLEHWLN